MAKSTSRKFIYDKHDFLKFNTNGGLYLYRVVALRDIKTPCGVVKKGTRGGYAMLGSLSQNGECWIDANSLVFRNCKLEGNAYLENSVLDLNCYVIENAHIKDSVVHAPINATFKNNAKIEDCQLECNLTVEEDACLVSSRIIGEVLLTGASEVVDCVLSAREGKIIVGGNEKLKGVKITGYGTYGKSDTLKIRLKSNKKVLLPHREF